jgi:hypothetical protein
VDILCVLQAKVIFPSIEYFLKLFSGSIVDLSKIRCHICITKLLHVYYEKCIEGKSLLDEKETSAKMYIPSPMNTNGGTICPKRRIFVAMSG